MKQLVMEEEGQGLSEYGMILGGVVVVAAAAVALLGPELRTLFNTVLNSLRGGAGTL
ncbi:Flp family type IVb pilin [Rossellomorea sp. LJF3]|uniref:Flp family type IVb pilin n=1 Tax=Rossellomorea sp. LJF3 TaxID=3126099 RepID=UPI00300DA196